MRTSGDIAQDGEDAQGPIQLYARIGAAQFDSAEAQLVAARQRLRELLVEADCALDHATCDPTACQRIAHRAAATARGGGHGMRWPSQNRCPGAAAVQIVGRVEASTAVVACAAVPTAAHNTSIKSSIVITILSLV